MQFQSWPIEQLPGFDKRYQQPLAQAGIYTTTDLLRQGSTDVGRQTLATQLQVPLNYITKWIALADLARLPSVGSQYCGLLLHAGVSSATQLAQMSAHRLHPQVQRLQVAMMQRRDLCPNPAEVSAWITEAKSLIALIHQAQRRQVQQQQAQGHPLTKRSASQGTKTSP